MDYFELFGFPVWPVADKSAAGKKYIELQRQFHPDHFTGATEAEKEEAERRSAAVNEAYAIFKDPDRTLEYYLKVCGVMQEDEKYELPPGFLMEMMELNEKAEDDRPEFEREVRELEESLLNEVSPILSRSPAETIYEAELLKLKDYYFKKKYLSRVLERLEDWANIAFQFNAQMAELVDAADSKSAVRKDVQVRLLFWARSKIPSLWLGIFAFKKFTAVNRITVVLRQR